MGRSKAKGQVSAMKYELEIKEEADEDVINAFSWYEVEENSVVVYAVFHTSQDPKKWEKRKT